MPVLDDLLVRFRRVWTLSGPAVNVGVPVDVELDRESELKELLAALEAVDREARAITGEAELEAARVVEAAREQAASLVEQAELRAPEVRAEAARARLGATRAAIDRSTSAAEREAALVLEHAEARAPELVEALLDRVFAGVRPGAGTDHGDLVGRR